MTASRSSSPASRVIRLGPPWTMSGLRRALQLSLARVWRRPLPGPACNGGGRDALPRPIAAGSRFSTFPGGQEPQRRRAAAPARHEVPEEEFVFLEYLPEEQPSSEGKPPQQQQQQQQREAEGEPDLERDGSELRRPRPRQAGGRGKPPKGSQRVTGRPDPSVPSSGVSCSGCGAELHCRDPAVPGYLPSEKYLSLVGSEELRLDLQEGGDDPERQSHKQQALEGTVCQRCWLLVHHQRALQVQVTQEEYRNLVSTALRGPPRHGRPPLVLCMVDMLDLPDSLLPNLPELVGDKAHIFVLGNKVDLLPGDSPKYLKHLQECLLETCISVGLVEPKQPGQTLSQRLMDVHLLSAKTGYGVEELISKLQRSWKLNGDVYLVGAVNVGKSTLFNTLLHSDYCKSRASDVIHRATISPWPGNGALGDFASTVSSLRLFRGCPDGCCWGSPC